jgi:hypothetical protein
MQRSQRSVGHLFWLGAFASLLCSSAWAGGTMFRCGSSYQDRPCDGGQTSKVIGSGGSVRQQASAEPAAKVDPECSERGNRAKQIAWGKEAGKTQDVQIAAATSEEERRLVADVYRRRGSSLDVRNGVEADCMAERERAAQAAALMEAAGKLLSQGKAASGASPSVPAPAVPPQAQAPAGMSPSVADKKSRCQALKEQDDSIVSKQRVGGNIDQMEQLNRQRQSAAKALRDAGC